MAIEKTLKLTQLSSCAGCAAKLNRTLLAEILHRLGSSPAAPANGDHRVIVGADTFDDAGVYRLTADMALVQTVDFFTPIVDDPTDYGKIAATNALSDVFAMGGRPITALNLLGIPADRVGPDAIAAILRGGASKVREAGCSLIGGHTIRSLEPIYGLSVTGIVHPRRIMTNSRRARRFAASHQADRNRDRNHRDQARPRFKKSRSKSDENHEADQFRRR